MDFVEILNLFGGTIFPEEYRGNLGEVDLQIAMLELAVSKDDVPIHQKARTLLLRGVYHILAADFSNARRHIQGVLELANHGLDKRWILRSKMYDFYVFIQQYRPSRIRFRPTLPDTWTLLNDTHSAFPETRLQAWAVANELAQRQPPSLPDILEQATIMSALTFIDILHRSFLAHPSYTRLVPTASLSPEYVGDLKPDNLPLKFGSEIAADFMAKLGKPALKHALGRCALEVESARGSANADRRRTQLLSEYEDAGDFAGMGFCKIMEGDSILSLPFTSPLSLNLITQVTKNGWENEPWDALQSAFRLHDDSRAQDCYTQALHYMEAACAPRGQAAVFLRRGCIYHAEALESAWRSESTQANQSFRLAEENFGKALNLFAKDIANLGLVNCHQLLLDVSRRASTDLVEKARDLGRKMHSTENRAMSQFFGLLMLRFGYFQFARYKNLDAASACCERACAYFEELDEPIASLSAAVAQITLLKESHNILMAQAEIRELVKRQGILAAAMEYMDRLIAKGPENNRLHFTKTRLLRELKGRARAVCSASGDEALRKDVDEALKSLRIDDPVTPVPTVLSQNAAIMNPDTRAQLNDPEVGFGESEMVCFMETFESMNSFCAKYSKCVEQCFQALGQGDVDAAEAHLRRFVTECDSVKGLTDREVLSCKIPALAQLGLVDTMRHELPAFLSPFFVAEGDEDLREKLKRNQVEINVFESAITERGNKAEEDIGMCFVAQAWDRGSAILKNVSKTLPEFLQKGKIAARPSCWKVMTFIGAFYEHEGKLEQALDWYLEAVSQFENLRKMIADPDSRRAAYSSLHTSEMYCGLIRTSLAFSLEVDEPKLRDTKSWGLPASSWMEQALIFMEQGKARSLLDILLVKETADTEQLQAWMQGAYTNRLLSTLFQPRYDDQKDVMTEAKVAKLLGVPPENFDRVKEALKDQQRATSALFRGTLFVPDTKGLFDSIPPDALVIEMEICMSSLVILCISSTAVVAMHQSNLGVWPLRKLVLNYVGKMKIARKNLTSVARATLKEDLMTIATDLSTNLIEPFAPLIQKFKSVIFVPTSYLNVFPLAALILNGKPLILEKTVYQVPSLSVFQQLRKMAHKRQKLTSISVLADAGGKKGLPPLPYVGPEVASICKSMAAKPKSYNTLSQTDLFSILESSHIVHISSHGTEVFSSPWESYLDIKEPLRVIDIAKAPCKASLIVFCACLSGKGQISSGNDILGFAHAVLQSGALAFIGGLWKVRDKASMLLMHIFYKRIAAHRRDAEAEGVRLADCWQEAVREFYCLNQERARALIEELLEVWMRATEDGIRPEGEFKYSRYLLEKLKIALQDDTWDFTDPLYWAPFCFQGYGSTVLW